MRLVFFQIVLCSSLLLFIGCRKKRGCTNAAAINYDHTAKKNDNSCAYNFETHFFWFNEHSYFIDNDISELNIYLDGRIVKEDIDVFDYAFGMSKSCDSSFWIKYSTIVILADYLDEYESYWEVFDQNQELLLVSSINLEKGECNQIGFKFE